MDGWLITTNYEEDEDITIGGAQVTSGPWYLGVHSRGNLGGLSLHRSRRALVIRGRGPSELHMSKSMTTVGIGIISNLLIPTQESNEKGQISPVLSSRLQAAPGVISAPWRDCIKDCDVCDPYCSGCSGGVHFNMRQM